MATAPPSPGSASVLSVERRSCEYTEFESKLKGVDRRTAVSFYAGLALDARNAHQLGRLEAAVGLTLRYAAGQEVPTGAELLQLVNEGVLFADLAKLEDPPDETLCEEVLGPGGGYLVGSGLSGRSVFVLRQAVKALFQLDPIDVFTESLLPVTVAALRLSDVVLRRAGLSRGLVFEGARGGFVTDSRHDELSRAVVLRLGPEDCVALRRDLAPLVGELTDVRTSSEAAELARRPFLFDGDRLIVAFPFEIASALLHHYADVVVEASVEDEFHWRYAQSVGEEVGAALVRMGMTPEPLESFALPRPRGRLPVAEGIYRFDDDKLVVSVTLADDLAVFDAASLYGFWPTAGLEKRLSRHLHQLDRDLRKRGVAEVLFVVTLAPFDRGLVLHLSVPGLRVIVLEASELETIAHVEKREPLALWKFVRARDEASARLRAFSQLDLFEAYRDGGASFPPEAAGLVVVMPGGGGLLRAECARRVDRHPAPHPSGVGVEVERWLPHAPKVPIYLPRSSPTEDFEVIVETPSEQRLWISARDSDGARPIAYVLAYWLWQVAADIDVDLAAVSDPNGTTQLRLLLEPEDLWEPNLSEFVVDELAANELGSRGGSVVDVVSSRPTEGAFVVRLGEDAWHALHSVDNAGERRLLSGILGALFPERGTAWIMAIVDRHAPLGYKTELTMARGLDPALNNSGLPNFRPVQAFDENRARRALGRATVQALELPDGSVIGTARNDVLHEYVAGALARLAEELSELSSVGLLERLVLRYESVVHEQRFRQSSLHIKELTYGGFDETLERRDEEAALLSRTAVATRFLIEFVTAQPPNGTKVLSTARFDELLALASEILDGGALSDALVNGTSDPELKVDNGEIEIRNDRHSASAWREFAEAQLRSELAAEAAPLAALVGEQPQELGETPRNLDDALKAEFGLSLIRLAQFHNTLIEWALELPGGVASVSVTDVLARFAVEGELDAEDVRRALDTFSLGSRKRFDEAPGGFRMSDVYPWRTNRRLSYLRRPLLRRGADVVFGVRHLFAALRHLTRQLQAGSYRAESAALVSILGEFGDAAGEVFEDDLADLFRDHGYRAEVRVKRFGALRIARASGEDLGDIDVLAVDDTRHELWAVDAKAVGLAMNHQEIAREVRALWGGGDDRSATRRHLRRVRWIEDHLEHVVGSFHLEPDQPEAWLVRPLIVTERPLLSAHLAGAPIPIVSFDDLRARLAAGEGIG